MQTPPALRRRVPQLSNLTDMASVKLPQFGVEARLSKAATIWDLRDIAKRRTPRAAFDYTDGAADGEITLRRSREAFHHVEFQPEVLHDVTTLDTTTEILGQTSTLPFGIAPTGFTRFMQSEGEYAGSAAAGDAGIPYTLSTLGTASLEEVAAHAPQTRRWFQLYVMRDQAATLDLLQRAKAAGNDTLMVTVDCATGGLRLRDVRNGMTMPPQLTLKTVVDASYRPAWWLNFLTRAPLEFSSLSSLEGTVSELLSAALDPALDLDSLDWIRSNWDGHLLVKGIQTVADAEKVTSHGADGVVLSNHGGRQLDRAPIPFHLLPRVREALGPEATIIMDTGIMHGSDIVAALACGADFTLIGRAYLYGLMAGGERGVAKTISILKSEIERTMRLLGVRSVAELRPEHVDQRAASI